jgi:hypothetical protein
VCARRPLARSQTRHGAVVAAGDEQVEDELASRGEGVDRVAQRAERDPALAERGDGVEQVAGRAAEPVELPDDEAQYSGRCQSASSHRLSAYDRLRYTRLAVGDASVSGAPGVARLV